jgi:ApbE superfamily uncharacterized protein (UPF0280 family)
MSVQVQMLGRRLHLNHGPIDLIIEAFGDPSEVAAAYRQAASAFPDVLPTLVKELRTLRTPLEPSLRGAQRRSNPGTLDRFAPLAMTEDGVSGPVAKRMVRACQPFAADFITPMAAVAGAVADHMLAEMLAGRTLDRAYVNDGGDIAFYLSPGARLTCGVVADLAAPAIDGTIHLTHDMKVRGIATSGRATKGQGGRSFSLGIADVVTVLARDAAAADAAATMIANAVDLPNHPAVSRVPATDLDPDSDLGERLVTTGVGPLADAEIHAALSSGIQRAEALRRSGLIHGAVLVLHRRFATVGAGLPLLTAE